MILQIGHAFFVGPSPAPVEESFRTVLNTDKRLSLTCDANVVVEIPSRLILPAAHLAVIMISLRVDSDAVVDAQRMRASHVIVDQVVVAELLQANPALLPLLLEFPLVQVDRSKVLNQILLAVEERLRAAIALVRLFLRVSSGRKGVKLRTWNLQGGTHLR